jgi:hypothetical protein
VLWATSSPCDWLLILLSHFGLIIEATSFPKAYDLSMNRSSSFPGTAFPRFRRFQEPMVQPSYVATDGEPTNVAIDGEPMDIPIGLIIEATSFPKAYDLSMNRS